MAHELYRVIACDPGGFKAFPIVDGKAIMPKANAKDATCMVLGDFLANVIDQNWIENGAKDLRAEATAIFLEAKKALAAAEEERIAEEERRVAKERKAAKDERAKYIEEQAAKEPLSPAETVLATDELLKEANGDEAKPEKTKPPAKPKATKKT